MASEMKYFGRSVSTEDVPAEVKEWMASLMVVEDGPGKSTRLRAALRLAEHKVQALVREIIRPAFRTQVKEAREAAGTPGTPGTPGAPGAGLLTTWDPTKKRVKRTKELRASRPRKAFKKKAVAEDIEAAPATSPEPPTAD